jgi:hypothetical protein
VSCGLEFSHKSIRKRAPPEEMKKKIIISTHNLIQGGEKRDE